MHVGQPNISERIVKTYTVRWSRDNMKEFEILSMALKLGSQPQELHEVVSRAKKMVRNTEKASAF